MKRTPSPRHTLAALLAALPLQALAEGPSYDCAKAQGEVEKLICNDAALAALDRQLGQVFKAASAQAKGALATRLREDQRGWVKGRNDCWKANGQKTWITATWTVDTVKGCVDAQYRLRISELQAVWRLLPPKTLSYACHNQPANELVANFFATDPPTIRAGRGDRSYILWRVDAGGRYEGPNVDLLQQGNDLNFSALDVTTGKTEELLCKPR